MENIGIIKKKTFRFSTPDKGAHFFEIEFEDGTVGIGIDKRSDGAGWVVGEEILYDLEKATWSKSGKEYNKITKRSVTKGKENVKALENKSTWNDPQNNHRMAMSMAYNHAVSYFIKMKFHANRSELDRVAKQFYDWICKAGDDRNTLSLRWYVVERAIMMMDLDAFMAESHTASLEEIIDRCEYLWNKLKEV